MKIRNGFVSNSSSSSFILKLSYYPESQEDIRRMLLGDENPLVLTHYDNNAFPTSKVIGIIYQDIIDAIGSNHKKPIDSLMISEIEIHEYTLDTYDSKVSQKYHSEFNKLKREYKAVEKQQKDYLRNEKSDIPTDDRRNILDDFYDRMERIGNKMRDIILKSIEEKSKDTDIYVNVSYSDNDGSIMAFIEHGGILDPITEARISHH